MNRVISIIKIASLNQSTYKKDEFPEHIKYLDTGNLTKNKINVLQFLNTSIDKIPSRAQRKVKKNTILYSTVRPNQEHFGFIENEIENLVVSTGFTTIDVFDDEIDAKYIYYLITQPHITNYLHTIGTNSVSAYPSISPSDIGRLKFKIPNFNKQQKIASVLSSLDAKIELNNLINTQLEQMAKTLYDYWFVQFDFPNALGKPYKSSGGKMVYNQELKREIPEGWEVKQLSDIANITMGQSPSGSSYNESGVGEIFFQGSTDFGWRFPSIRQFTMEPNRMAKIGDILLSVRAPVGTLNIADNNCCIGRGLAALNSKEGYSSHLYYVMENFKKLFDYRNSVGTTFGAITKDDLYSLELVYPKNEQLKKYNSIVAKYNSMILNNHKQNQQLSSLRDWLLPMLMNGQVTVKEAEEKVSELRMAAELSLEYKKR